jgi:hypothetical protein
MFFIGGSLGAVGATALDKPWISTVGVAALFFWTWVVWSFAHRWKVSWFLQALSWSVPASCVVALALGYTFAVSDMTLRSGDTSIKLKDGPPIGNVVVLRHLEKGVLLRVADSDRIRFIPWDGISEFSSGTRPGLVATPLLCSWIGVLCP